VYPELGRGWPSDGFGAIAIIAGQLPDPKELPDGAVVLVREAARPPRTWWARLIASAQVWRRRPTAHRAVRCTALLALGYRDVSIGHDPRTAEAVAWGVVATSVRSSSAP